MLGRGLLIAQRLCNVGARRQVRTYGSGWIGDRMSLLVVGIFVSVIAVNHAVDVDNYPDIPEDLFVERLANRLHHQRTAPGDAYFDAGESTDDADMEAAEDRIAEPEFTFQFPPDIADRDAVASSPFVRPPDPRYYHDTRQPMLAPLNSVAAQDDDVFEPPRVWPSTSAPSTAATVTEEAEVERPVPPPRPVAKQAAEWPLGMEESLSSRMSVDSLEAARKDAVLKKPLFALSDQTGLIFFTIVFVCCSVAVMLVLVIALAWVKLTRRAKAAADVEYPAYGVTGPHQKEPSPTGDRKLAQSAQMYHYQHQKQQIIAMESRAVGDRRGSAGSPAESDEDNDEGDYTVYECPGLAPTGEMEVKNPLFHDDPTPATPAPKDK